MTHFTLHVDGIPIPQGSKSVSRQGWTYEANKRLTPWRRHVANQVRLRAEAVGHEQFTVPVHVRLVFVLPRPKHHWRSGRNAHLLKDSAPRHPGVKPDVDKLVRAVFDALTVAGVWKDDSLAVSLAATKRYPVLYSTPDPDFPEQPGVYIDIDDVF